jgi:hypothetical protein
MATRAEINCINKSGRMNPHERIQNVGGGFGTNRWKQSEDQTIREIENGSWTYYVTQGGRTVDVIVATRLGRKYLKTVADGESPDNLLSLPECP